MTASDERIHLFNATDLLRALQHFLTMPACLNAVFHKSIGQDVLDAGAWYDSGRERMAFDYGRRL